MPPAFRGEVQADKPLESWRELKPARLFFETASLPLIPAGGVTGERREVREPPRCQLFRDALSRKN
jgi:hypothetical protein